MGLFSRKPKMIRVEKYRALTSGGARKKFEKDAERLARQGYEIADVQDKSHWYGQRGDITVTYRLRQPLAG